MVATWQTLPLYLEPIAGTLGGLPITWYALLYAFGALLAAVYFIHLVQRRGLVTETGIVIELLINLLWGVLIGARLGYVVFYGGAEFIDHPWRIISPYDFEQDVWVGIRGMSFHGGLLGGIVGLIMFTREGGRSFWRFSDALVPAVPIALFFGRIGNFLNQELVGRATQHGWGMQFPGMAPGLYHPVTLYEAALEGIFLFVVLNFIRRWIEVPGKLTVVFLISYALVRYWAEDYRATPLSSELVFGMFSMGQTLSLVMGVVGVVLFVSVRKRVV